MDILFVVSWLVTPCGTTFEASCFFFRNVDNHRQDQVDPQPQNLKYQNTGRGLLTNANVCMLRYFGR